MLEPPPITLLTDFGTRSPYVAAMRGVIARIAPGAAIHDLTHEIEPGNVREGALAIDAVLPYWPARAVHVCVVDPGVGSGRRRIVVDSDLGLFVGPDNGLFTFVFARAGRWRAYELANASFFLPRVSSTFHGRDVFAPVGAHLAAGACPADLGSLITGPVLVDFPAPQVGSDRIQGEVIEIDRFGNMITNIDAALLDGSRAWVVQIAGASIHGVSDHYAQTAPGELIALLSSSARLEIAVNRGSAAERLGREAGTPVVALRAEKRT